jgi:mycothiol synthase
VAAAWQTTWEGLKIGLIHNVGVDTDFLGLGLGRAVTIFALDRLRERGFERALLATEDYRLPAINLYLSLGFRPVCFNWFHERRWMRILQRARPATDRSDPSGPLRAPEVPLGCGTIRPL